MDDIAADLGELIFSLVVSYFGALEFFFVLRQWCHLTGKHPPCREFNDESLKELKEKLQRKIADAKEKEKQSGTNVMQDGVPYTDGYRIDPNQAEIDRLKAEINAKDSKEKRRAEIEAELAAHRKIEEETRKQLEAAEAELARQRAKTAADAKAESEAKAKAKAKAEAEAEAEEERKRKEQEEKAKAASEEAENYRKLLEAEKQREADQQAKEKENEALRLKREQEEKLFAAEKQREWEEKDKEEREKHAQGSASEKFLDAERAREEKQKLIEENARKFLEAEEKMVQLQQKILEASNIPIVEEPIVKRSAKRLDASAPQTVKTQFGQGSNESFTLSSKPLLFPSISDDASSNEPHSSKHSSFSTQPSDEMTTGPENASKIAVPQHERQDPDGEDNTPSVEYTEDYLRSLDGLKVHPLTREDGSGRRRAFKKRRSSGSSNSSRDSRASRDEELKMFTSLEEEESKSIREGDKNDFTPIKYTSEPNLKVKSHHHRRHKRSPMQDAKANEDTNLRTSLEMLGEEGSNPWGEVVPEHYKNTEFWRREKAMSIDEEEIELDFTTLGGENQAKSSSFEDATDQQNEQAITELHSNHSKELNEKDKEQEVRDALANDGTKADTEAEKSKDTNTRL